VTPSFPPSHGAERHCFPPALLEGWFCLGYLLRQKRDNDDFTGTQGENWVVKDVKTPCRSA
jgi:hypothetical protein